MRFRHKFVSPWDGTEWRILWRSRITGPDGEPWAGWTDLVNHEILLLSSLRKDPKQLLSVLLHEMWHVRYGEGHLVRRRLTTVCETTAEALFALGLIRL